MRIKQIFTLVLLIFGSASFFAAEPDSLEVKRRVYDLEGLTIKAQASSRTLGYSLSREISPEVQGSALNVSDLIVDIPGIRLTTSGKGVSDLRMRGFFRKQIKIMINGRPLNAGYFGNVDLHTLPVVDVERINIIKGPLSAQYGANTMGGAIDIVTNEINPGWQSIARFSFDRNSTSNVSYIGSYGIRNHGFRINLARSDSPGYYLSDKFEPTTFEDGGRRNRSAYSRYSGGLGWQGYIASIHSLDFQASYIYMDNKEIPSPVYEANFRRYTDWRNYNLSLRHTVPITYNLDNDLTLYFDHNTDTYVEYSDSSYQNPTMTSELASSLYGIKWDTNWNYSDWLVFNQGYLYELNSFDRIDDGPYQDGYSGSIVTHQAYLQPELNFGSSLTLTTGFNFSFFQVNDTQQNTDLSAGIFYSFADNIRTSLSYSRNNRYPILQELFSSSSGNPYLLPERADKFEATVGMPFNLGNTGGYFHLAFFRNDIFNLIEPQYNPEDGNRIYQNVEKADNYGTDLDITINPWNFWLASLSYSLILSDRTSDYSLLRMPRHSFVVSNKVNITDNFCLNQKSEFYSERDDLDNSDNLQVLETYNLHNISFSYRYRTALFSTGIDNIFDTLYYERYGFPGRGRNFFFSLELRI